MVTSDVATAAQKEVKTNWPNEEGLELGTTKLREKGFLEYEETIVPDRKKVGL